MAQKKRRKRRRKYKIHITLPQGVVFALTAICLLLGVQVSLNGEIGGAPTWNDLYELFHLSVQPKGLANLPEDAQAVHFIDIGQGDATLLQSGQEYCLVDAGLPDSEEALLNYLDAQGVKRLKLLVMSHPHADHIGSMKAVLEQISVDQILLPDFDKAPYPTSRTFERVMETIAKKKIPTVTAKEGRVFEIGDATLTVIADGVKTDNFNDLSQVLAYKAPGLSVVLSGDGEKAVEQDAVAAGNISHADVFKAGHHGSNTSNSMDFLQAIRPQFVVISCGKDNSYGHPHKEPMQRFKMAGAQVLRTDQNGSVVIAAGEQGLECYAEDAQESSDQAA